MTTQKDAFLERIRTEWYRPDIVRYVPEALPFEALAALPKQAPTGKTPLDLVDPEKIIQYYLILNSINHQFWSLGEQGEMVRYSHDGKVGALAMHAGIDRLIGERGFDLKDKLTPEDIGTYFGPMPDPVERCKILNEAFANSGPLAKSLEAEAVNGWTVLEALTIAQALPSGYKDEALKKAQLALYMSAQALLSIGVDVNVDLTVFADYQLPKVMRHLGQLEYSPELAAKIDRGELLEADGVEERAIRSATMLCAEDTSERSGVPTGPLDYWYWLQRNDTKLQFHRTFTVAY